MFAPLAQQSGDVKHILWFYDEKTQHIVHFLEIVKKVLANGEDVPIRGFGKFCVKDKEIRRRSRKVPAGAQFTRGQTWKADKKRIPLALFTYLKHNGQHHAAT